MKRIVSLFFTPLLALAIAAMCVEVWRRFGNRIDTDLLQMIMVASTAFCVALVVINHLMQWITATKISRFHSGAVAYERDIRQRLEVLSGTSARLSELEAIEQRLEALEERSPDTWHQSRVSGALDTKPAQDEPDRPDIDESAILAATTDGKVIPLDPTKRAAVMRSREKRNLRYSGKLAAHINEGRLTMFLQPIVSLPGREVPAYKAVARIVLEDETVITARDFWPEAEETGLVADIDRAILEQSISLLRSLRRKKQTVEVFWNISPLTLQTKPVFGPVYEILKANTPLANTLVASISQVDFESLSKKQTGRLEKIGELGFKLSLDNCTNIAGVQKTTTSGLFSFIKIPVSILEQYSGEDTENIAEQLADLIQNRPVRLIATGVEKENQVISLIDNDISLAQGNLFSPPRPLRSEPDDAAKHQGTGNQGSAN